MRPKMFASGVFGLGIGAVMIAPGGARAENADATIARLEQRMEAMAGEIAALKKEQAALRKTGRRQRASSPPTRAIAGKGTRPPVPTVRISKDEARIEDYASGNSLKVDYGGAPQFAILDPAGETIFSFKPRGRILVDLDQASGDTLAPGASLGGLPLDPARDPYPSPDVMVRDLRLGVEGVMFRKLDYKLEVDYSGSKVSVKDAYLGYDVGSIPTNIRFGQFKHPTSLSEQTSSRFLTFAERPMFTDAFDFSRRVGAAAFATGDHFSISGGVFGDSVEDNAYDDGFLVAGRAVYAPINTFADDDVPVLSKQALHLGASAFYRRRGDGKDGRLPYDFYDGDVIRGNPDFFASFDFPGDSDTFLGAELAYVSGPFSLQGEYGVDLVDSKKVFSPVSGLTRATDDPTFHGGYVEASYFLTRNAARNYEVTDFGRPLFVDGASVLEGGTGAVELAGRFDYLNLDSGGLAGGEIYTYGVGLNWWTTRYSRFLLDYLHSDVNGATDVAFKNGLPVDNSVDSFIARAQVDF